MLLKHNARFSRKLGKARSAKDALEIENKKLKDDIAEIKKQIEGLLLADETNMGLLQKFQNFLEKKQNQTTYNLI